GEVEFAVEGERAPQLLAMHITDKGPGIANLESILEGNYRSATVMGLGLIGARRLMDHFAVRSSSAGTSVTLHKLLPENARLFTAAEAGRIAEQLSSGAPHTPLDELQQQNRELMRTMEELRQRQDELL